ncbi:MAG: PIN domain-containing protein [Thermoplasmata archaeon]|nr:PIN domain-containing protein [Thermoplasmata archaeon]
MERSNKVVILDTSVALAVFENLIDLEEKLVELLGDYKIVVPSTVKREIENLARYGKGKARINAKSALRYIKRFEVVESMEREVDKSIIELASKLRAAVATNDRELKKKLRKLDLPVIYTRERKKLSLEGIF